MLYIIYRPYYHLILQESVCGKELLTLISKGNKDRKDVLLDITFSLDVSDPHISQATVDHVIRNECTRFYGETFPTLVRWEMTKFEVLPGCNEVALTLRVPSDNVTRLISCLSLITSYLDNRSVFHVRRYSLVSK